MTCNLFRSTMYKIGKRREDCFDEDKLATGTKLQLTMEVLLEVLPGDIAKFVPRAMCIDLQL